MRKTAYGYAHAGLLILVAGILVAATAHAAVAANTMTYTTRADFDAEAGPTRVVDFATDDFGDPLSNPSADVGYPFLGLSGVCFQDVRSYYNSSIYTYPNATITVDLPSGTYAFGTDLAPFYPIDGTNTVTLSTGEVFQFAADLEIGWIFFGVVSDTPIDWVTFTYDTTYFVLDNFAITSTAGPGRGCPTPPFIPVEIDIKPGSDPNCFNNNGHGVIPVAILGTADFDVRDIDTLSLALDGFAVRMRGNKGPLCAVEYSNADNYRDLVCHFEDSAPGNWTTGDDEATVRGALVDGTPIEGTDNICVVQ